MDNLNLTGIVDGEWDWEDEMKKKYRLPDDTPWPELPIPGLPRDNSMPDIRIGGDELRYAILLKEYGKVQQTDRTGKSPEEWYEEIKAECEKNPDKIREYSMPLRVLLEQDLGINADAEE